MQRIRSSLPGAVVGNVFLGITTDDMTKQHGLDIENCEQEAGRRTPRANTKRKRLKYSLNPPDENNSQAMTYPSRKYAYPYNIVNVAQPQYCQGQPSHIPTHKQQFVGYFIYSLLSSPGGPAIKTWTSDLPDIMARENLPTLTHAYIRHLCFFHGPVPSSYR